MGLLFPSLPLHGLRLFPAKFEALHQMDSLQGTVLSPTTHTRPWAWLPLGQDVSHAQTAALPCAGLWGGFLGEGEGWVL